MGKSHSKHSKLFLFSPQIFIDNAFIVYFRPLPEYCSTIWLQYIPSHIDQIERVQRHVTKKLWATSPSLQRAPEETQEFRMSIHQDSFHYLLQYCLRFTEQSK